LVGLETEPWRREKAWKEEEEEAGRRGLNI
jgi:hypothetical protein